MFFCDVPPGFKGLGLLGFRDFRIQAGGVPGFGVVGFSA